ncbi:hypothetical protein PInf_009924 [Phytophthora infestans]|nr:hypothetical protein PInf_009924 [Phytophthora infestans]
MSSNSKSKVIRCVASRDRPKSTENRRVVRQEVLCTGSLRVRSCKLLWKPAALQLMVTTTSSLDEDEAHFDDCDDDSDDSDDNDVDTVTTMAQPNETHHYTLVCCHRSLMGYARREKIELESIRDPVEFIWGEDGLLSTRFEFSIVYGSVGPSGRRRTLTCRARDAKEYLQWTEALRMCMESQGKNKGNKGVKMNCCTPSSTLTSSKAPSIDSFFDTDVVEEARKRPPTPTSPTVATAIKAIAPPEANVVEESALKPVPADIAAVYGSPSSLAESSMDYVGSRNERSNIESVRTINTNYVNSLNASSRQRQQLLLKENDKSYIVPLKSEKMEDAWLRSRDSSRLNLDACDFEDMQSARSTRRRAQKASWAAYLKAMECEL